MLSILVWAIDIYFLRLLLILLLPQVNFFLGLNDLYMIYYQSRVCDNMDYKACPLLSAMNYTHPCCDGKYTRGQGGGLGGGGG